MMKTTIMVMMVAGGLAMQAVAAGTDNGPSAYTKNQPTTWQPFYKLLKSKTPTNYKIERVGNISSRPWVQVAGRPAPAAFFDQRVHEADFNLFWIGARPD